MYHFFAHLHCNKRTSSRCFLGVRRKCGDALSPSEIIFGDNCTCQLVVSAYKVSGHAADGGFHAPAVIEDRAHKGREWESRVSRVTCLFLGIFQIDWREENRPKRQKAVCFGSRKILSNTCPKMELPQPQNWMSRFPTKLLESKS